MLSPFSLLSLCALSAPSALSLCSLFSLSMLSLCSLSLCSPLSLPFLSALFLLSLLCSLSLPSACYLCSPCSFYEEGGFSTLAIDDYSITMGEILATVIRKRRLHIHGMILLPQLITERCPQPFLEYPRVLGTILRLILALE